MITILEEQPTLLHLRAPIKIFGDIHGRLDDVLRFFENCGSPSDHGFFFKHINKKYIYSLFKILKKNYRGRLWRY